MLTTEPLALIFPIANKQSTLSEVFLDSQLFVFQSKPRQQSR